MNAEDEMFQQQRKCWLVYGRALLTITILGLVTAALFAATKSNSDKDEHDSKINVFDESTLSRSSRVELLKGFKSDDEAAIAQLNQRRQFKRSVDLRQNDIEIDLLKIPKNSVKSAKSANAVSSDNDNQHLKQLQRQGASQNQQHRHSDGDIYYFQGYKCVPMRKPQKQFKADAIRARQNLGMLCCLVCLVSHVN